MNSDFMRWLLDLDVIPRDADETLRMTWEHPWASWVWSLLFLMVGLFAFWSYTRLAGHRKGRGVMAIARALLILLVLVVISGPMLELPRESIEEDWVLVLVDRSESMQIQDAEGTSGRITRDEQIKNTLESHSEMLKSLGEEKQLVYLGFHFGAFDLASETTTYSLIETGTKNGGTSLTATFGFYG